jgi:para-nitrobenzyl esterase
MATYWTNFAKSGEPNGDGVPVWPNFTTDSERVLHLDASATAGGAPNLKWPRRLNQCYAGLRAATAAVAE